MKKIESVEILPDGKKYVIIQTQIYENKEYGVEKWEHRHILEESNVEYKI